MNNFRVVYINKLTAEYLGFSTKIYSALINNGYLGKDGNVKFYLEDILKSMKGKRQFKVFRKIGVLTM